MNIRPVFSDADSFEDVLHHLNSAKEERALVIVGALLVENAIDELLSAFIPDYVALRDEADFSFSLKIKLGRALQICPAYLLTCADTVREIRNEFAHNLSAKTLSNLLKGKGKKKRNLTESMRYCFKQFSQLDFEKGYEPEAFQALIHCMVEYFYYFRLQAG